MNSKRLHNIDVLRAIAALLVVWQHSFENFIGAPDTALIETSLSGIILSTDFGRIGVVCFFLISGFVIPFSFSHGPKALRFFSIRRFFRLYPVYWVSVLGAALATLLLTNKPFESGTIIANLSMLQTLFGEPHIQGLYWTLQAELAFYVLCGLVLATGIPNRPITYLFASLISLGVFMIVSLLNFKFRLFANLANEVLIIPYALAIMFCGTLLRTILDPTESYGTKKLLLIGPLAVFGLPLMIFLLHIIGIDLVDSPVRFSSSHFIGLGIFIVGYIWIKTNNSFLLWLGTISYSIYLFHPVAIKLVQVIRRNFQTADITSDYVGFYIGVVFLLSIFIASIIYLLVEKPSMNLGYKLSTPDSKKL